MLRKYLGRHVPLGADPVGRGHVHRIVEPQHVVSHGQPEISDHTGQVALHEDVLGLQVAVGDRRLACNTHNIQYITFNFIKLPIEFSNNNSVNITIGAAYIFTFTLRHINKIKLKK